MKNIPFEDLPTVLEDGPLRVRLRDEYGISVGHVALPAGEERDA
jgi:hypothetical protein